MQSFDRQRCFLAEVCSLNRSNLFGSDVSELFRVDIEAIRKLTVALMLWELDREQRLVRSI